MAPTIARPTKPNAAKKRGAGASTKKTTTTITTFAPSSRTGIKIRLPMWAWEAATAFPIPSNSLTGKTGIKIWLPKVGKQPVRRKLWDAATSAAMTPAAPDATPASDTTRGTEIAFRMYLATQRGQAFGRFRKPDPRSA